MSINKENIQINIAGNKTDGDYNKLDDKVSCSPKNPKYVIDLSKPCTKAVIKSKKIAKKPHVKEQRRPKITIDDKIMGLVSVSNVCESFRSDIYLKEISPENIIKNNIYKGNYFINLAPCNKEIKNNKSCVYINKKRSNPDNDDMK